MTRLCYRFRHSRGGTGSASAHSPAFLPRGSISVRNLVELLLRRARLVRILAIPPCETEPHDLEVDVATVVLDLRHEPAVAVDFVAVEGDVLPEDEIRERLLGRLPARLLTTCVVDIGQTSGVPISCWPPTGQRSPKPVFPFWHPCCNRTRQDVLEDQSARPRTPEPSLRMLRRLPNCGYELAFSQPSKNSSLRQ